MAGRQSLAKEFWAFLMANKKWWLLPLIVLMVALAALVFLSGTAIAPFVYTVF